MALNRSIDSGLLNCPLSSSHMVVDYFSNHSLFLKQHHQPSTALLVYVDDIV